MKNINAVVLLILLLSFTSLVKADEDGFDDEINTPDITVDETEDIHIQTNYDFIEQGIIPLSCTDGGQKRLLREHKNIIFCKQNALCIKTDKKTVCFESNDNETKKYSLLGEIPNKDIAVVRYEGDEEFFDYFISLKSGNQVLELPSISGGFFQTKISPKQNFMLVITTNDGYAGNPNLTDIDVYKLTEDPINNQLSKEITVTIEEETPGPRTYDVIWLNDETIKVQGIENNNDYIILSLRDKKWSIKNKCYKTWKDYEPYN